MQYVLLDIHGVLTAGDERRVFLTQMAKEYHMDYDKHNTLWSAHVESLDDGTIKESDYIKLVNDTFNTELTVQDYFLKFVQKIKVNKPLLEKLSTYKNIDVYISSDNISAISITLNRILGSVFERYEKFYSFELGITKSKGMLQKVIKKLNVEPKECLFIDDSAKNIQVAKELGINAILYKNNDELFKDLMQFNLSH